MFEKLHKKLTIICTTSTAIILIVVACISMYAVEIQLTKSGVETFISNFNSVIYSISEQRIISNTWLANTETNSKSIIYIEDKQKPIKFDGSWDMNRRKHLIEMANRIAKESYNFDVGHFERNENKTRKQMFEFYDNEGEKYYAVASTISKAETQIGLIIVKSTSDQENQIMYLRCVTIVVLIVAIVCLWIFAWIFTREAIKPVEKSQRSQMEFVSSASHELRSPLAVIQSSVSAMEYASPEQNERFKAAVTDECIRMSRLVNDMLSLAAADSGTWSVQKTMTDLETLILTCTELYESTAKKKNIRISVTLPTHSIPKCSCDKHRIEQVLSIFIDNAISYTDENGHIRVSAKTTKNAVQISVADNGKGIADESKEHIFDRFYREDKARTQKEHYGLGLSIAKEIINLHSGKIWVQDTIGGGSTFVIEIPYSPKNRKIK